MLWVIRKAVEVRGDVYGRVVHGGKESCDEGVVVGDSGEVRGLPVEVGTEDKGEEVYLPGSEGLCGREVNRIRHGMDAPFVQVFYRGRSQ